MNTIKKILLFGIIAGLLFILGYSIGFFKRPVPVTPEPVHHWHTEYVYDTITDVQYKDRFIYRYDTTFLNCVDTLYDSVLVEVPIYQYKFDTAGVKATVSGFNVSLDSLQVETKIITDSVIVPYEQRKWHWGFGFAIGFGYVR